MSLTFDEGPHEYRWNGTVVPSVTQIIRPFSDDKMRFVKPDVLELARAKGVATHRMAELHFLGRLARVPAWQEGCMTALLDFVERERFVFTQAEQRLHHPAMGYAGTPDLQGFVRGEHALIDLKRSLIGGRTIGLQLSGYKRLIEAQLVPPPPIQKRFALVLGEDGKYTLHEFKDPRDDAAFIAALTLFKWQRQGVTI